MRIGLTIVALLGFGLMGCGGGIAPTFGVAPPDPNAKPNADASVVPVKVASIAGTYLIDTVTFETAPGFKFSTTITLSHSLQTWPVSVNGVPTDMQLRLDKAYLIIGANSNFTFYYSIVDQNSKPVKVGVYDAGSTVGMMKTGVGEIGFSINDSGVTDEIAGLADEQETMYLLTLGEKDTIALKNVTADTPTPHFSKISATKSK